MNLNLRPEDIQQMRQILAQYDARESQPKIRKECDLNNPPRELCDPTAPPGPYRFQEFPMMLYGPEGETRVVQNPEERSRLFEIGWSAAPPISIGQSSQNDYLPEEDRLEVERLDRIARRRKRES